MKNILSFLLISTLMFSSSLFAAIKVHDELKPSIWGKKKLLKEVPNEIVISNFAINFLTGTWAGTGTAGNGLGVAGYLHLEDELASSIANDAKDYLVKKLKEKGYTAVFYTPEQAKESKAWSKAIKKGAKELNGGIYKMGHKMVSKGNSYTIALADGVPVYQAKEGKKHVPLDFLLLAGKMDLSFDPTLYFIKVNASTGSRTHNTNWEPQLAISNGELGNAAYHRYFNKKFKQASVVLIPHVLSEEDDSWIGKNEEKSELYGTSVHYTVDPVKYKAAVDGMLQHYIDSMVEALAANLNQG